MAAYKEGTSVDGQAQLAIKETLLKISRKELGLCEKVHCLRGIVNNLEEYRSRVKDSISG